MANALGIRFNATSVGTGDFVDASAVQGYRAGAGNLVDRATYRYRAENPALTEWEWGTGVWNAATSTLARTTIEFSSTGSKVSFTTAPQVSIVIFPRDVREVLSANRTYAISKTGSDSNSGLATGPIGTLTFTNASSNIGWTAHNRSVGDNFIPATTGALPTNFDTTTLLYVKTVVDANNIIASRTSGGSAITAGSAGSGSHTATVYSPFLTPNKAMSVIASALDLADNTVNVQIGGGTYADLPFIAQPYVGGGTVALIGDIATPSNVNFTISSVVNAIFSFDKVGGNWTIHGFKISSSVGAGNGSGINVTGNLGLVSFGNMEFGALAGGNHVAAIYGGHIENDAAYTISGGAAYHLFAGDSSICHTTASATITITGTPAFSGALVYAHGAGAVIGTVEANYSGAINAASISAAADALGVVDISNVALMPGTGTASVSGGGQVAGVVGSITSSGSITAAGFSTAGSISAGGTIAAAGSLSGAGFSSTGAPASTNALRGTITISIGANSNAIACPASTTGIVIVTDGSVSGVGAIFFIPAGGTVTVISTAGSVWSNTTTPAASHFGFAWDGANFRIYNGFGSTVVFHAMSASAT